MHMTSHHITDMYHIQATSDRFIAYAYEVTRDIYHMLAKTYWCISLVSKQTYECQERPTEAKRDLILLNYWCISYIVNHIHKATSERCKSYTYEVKDTTDIYHIHMTQPPTYIKITNTYQSWYISHTHNVIHNTDT